MVAGPFFKAINPRLGFGVELVLSARQARRQGERAKLRSRVVNFVVLIIMGCLSFKIRMRAGRQIHWTAAPQDRGCAAIHSHLRAARCS